MKRILLLFILLLLFTSCNIDLTQRYEKIILITVALDYKNISSLPNLQGTLNDQKAIEDQFKYLCKETNKDFSHYFIRQEGTNITSSTGNSIAIDKIKNELLVIFDEAKNEANDNDLVIFYYSGHGSNPVLDTNFAHLTGSLCLGDFIGSYTNWETVSTNFKYFMPPKELRRELNNINGKKLILLDSCFSGNHIQDDEIFDSLFNFKASYYDNIWELASSSNTEASWSGTFGIFTEKVLTILGYNFKAKKPGMPSRDLICLTDIYNEIYYDLIANSQTVQNSKSIQDLVLFNL